MEGRKREQNREKGTSRNQDKSSWMESSEPEAETCYERTRDQGTLGSIAIAIVEPLGGGEG
jgi:hypothetical protein